MEKHVYYYDDLIIGATLQAIIYSYFMNVPIITIKNHRNIPFPFEDFDIKEIPSLKEYYIPIKMRYMYGLDDVEMTKTEFNIIPQIMFYHQISFCLSINGLMPFYNMIEKIDIIPEEKTVIVITTDIKKYTLKYNNLLIFDSIDLSGLEELIEEQKDKDLMVADWWLVKCGILHDYDFLDGDDNFVNKIYFPPAYKKKLTCYFNGKLKKDAVSVSFLKESQYNDIQYSDIYSRLKTVMMMRKANIHGKAMWERFRKNGRMYYLKAKIEFREREKRYLSYDKYHNTDSISFCTDKTVKEMFELFSGEEWLGVHNVVLNRELFLDYRELYTFSGVRERRKYLSWKRESLRLQRLEKRLSKKD